MTGRERLSVIVCTKDRPAELACCIATLAHQTRAPDELIVVDASSVPATAAAIEETKRLLPATTVRWLETAPGLPRQRNRGARLATGSVVLFLDDDVLLEPEYLAEIARVYEADLERRVGGVGGAQVPDPTPRESRWRAAFCRLFLLESYGAGRVKRSGRPEYLLSPAGMTTVEFLSGCNMSFRREVLEQHRFDERLSGYALGEDLQFSYRVSRRWPLVLTPHARLEHRQAVNGRPDVASFRAMAVLNKYLFFREDVARRPLDWAAYAWAAVGDLLLRLRAPRQRALAGFLRGYVLVLRHALLGAVQTAAPRTPARRRADCALPRISVVVPARDEERSLGACLDSIRTQTYPSEACEIVVVENGSRDRTRAIALAQAARDPRIRVLVSDATNHAEALNEGIMAARGDIVARVDGHSRIAPDYLERVVQAFARHPRAAGVGGPFLPAGETLRERVVGLARSCPYGVGGGYGTDRVAADHPVRSVQCGAYWRTVLVEVGLFDPAMAYGEDEELNWRIVRAGWDVMLCPDLQQPYRPRSTLRALLRQYWRYGQGRVGVLAKHPGFFRPRHLAPTLFVVALVVLGTAAVASPIARSALLALLVAYAAVLLASAAWAARRASWRDALLVPVAVGCLHVGYGAGMLAGASRLATRAAAARRRRTPRLSSWHGHARAHDPR